MYDYIMVGGGVTGLELSALLSDDGARVLLLEKTGKLGGRALLWKKDGFTVDYGMHLIRFGPKSAISAVSRKLGREIEYVGLGKSRLLDEDGKVKLFPTGPLGFLLSKMFTTRERLSALKRMIRVRKENFHDLKDTSVKEWMDREGFKGGMRRYFHLVSGSMLVCPFIEKASVGELLINVQKVLKTGISVMYPKEGWEPLFELFIRKIEEKGQIRESAAVDKIIVEGGKAVGVKVGSEVIKAGKVITCVPCQQLFTVLDESLVPGDYAKMCRELRPNSGVALDYGLKKRISEDTGLWCMWKPMSFGIFTSNLAPTLAPAGKQLLTWVFPTPLEDMEDSKVAKKREDELEAALFALFPALKDSIEWRRAMHLKMIDGTEINTRQYREKRPGFRVPGVENLFLVGDSTAATGAGGDVGQESVLECYETITGTGVK